MSYQVRWPNSDWDRNEASAGQVKRFANLFIEGKVALNIREVDLIEVIEGATASVAALHREKGYLAYIAASFLMRAEHLAWIAAEVLEMQKIIDSSWAFLKRLNFK